MSLFLLVLARRHADVKRVFWGVDMKKLPQPVPQKPVHRTGFTLLELLLATAILSVLIGLAVPAINSILQRQQFQSVTGQVEQFLSEIRRQAGSTGQTYFVRYSSNDRWLASGIWGQPVSSSFKLPEKYQFSHSSLVEKLETEDLGVIGFDGANLYWSEETLFFSDGTSEDLAFQVLNPAKQERQILIRGLTGQISSKPHSSAEGGTQ